MGDYEDEQNSKEIENPGEPIWKCIPCGHMC